MKPHYCFALLSFGFLPLGIANNPSERNVSKAESPSDIWGKEVGGLRLSLRSSRKVYEVGEKFHIDMVLRNVGAKDWRVLCCDPLYLYSFEAWGPDGRKLPLTPQAKGRISRGFEGSRNTAYLEPKDEDTLPIGIYWVFDMKKPGTYRIVAKREVVNLLDEKQSATVFSNPLTIAIAPPKERKDK